MTPPLVNFLPGAGGSDWDTFADGILWDQRFDTGRATYPSTFPDAGNDQQLIEAYTTSAWSTKWGRSRGISHPGQYTSTTGFTYSYDCAYDAGSGTESEFPPYIAVWQEKSDASQYGAGRYSRGWSVLQREDPLYSLSSASVTYVVIHSPEGVGEGLSSRSRGTVKVALTDYDGNAANWRDFDGWTLTQVMDWEIGSTSTSPWTISSISNHSVTKNWFAVGGSFPQGCWRNGQPRLVFGSEAANYGATSGALGSASQYQFSNTTDAQAYLSRVAMFQENISATYYDPVVSYSTGSQTSYNNTPFSLGGGTTPSAGDIIRIYVYDWS